MRAFISIIKINKLFKSIVFVSWQVTMQPKNLWSRIWTFTPLHIYFSVHTSFYLRLNVQKINGEIMPLHKRFSTIVFLLIRAVARGGDTGGADYAHHSTTSPPGFSDLETALLKVAFFQKVGFVFQISKSKKNIPKNYPELEI